MSRYYYSVNEKGSTNFITDDSGNIKNEYWYDAFGNVLASKEDVHNRITYTGQQFDGITQQYYLRARFYNPVIGRFTQEDVYRGDGLNLYAYCGNNPVRYYDPSGYACETKASAFGEMPEADAARYNEYWKKVSFSMEGEIGTYSELIKSGKWGDNITPHHMPSAEYMSKKKVSKNDGLCMNVDQPKKGGRHRETYTYGRNMTNEQKNFYYALSPRDALAFDLNNLKEIYIKDGIYKEMAPKLKEYAKKYIEYMPDIFGKKEE
ncbi:RHS repeat-associated core domain-containing protein [Clostridium sp. ZBS13]|uniref:RHS repeat-associated core domain-containing protein n=1 Tax=Clostridium sp. ZBS13 TaxID=2949971 RepID=UPI0020796323|nr:RHS repeat-associated core domain-containing protein [Clostridium sp. ZBS13]